MSASFSQECISPFPNLASYLLFKIVATCPLSRMFWYTSRSTYRMWGGPITSHLQIMESSSQAITYPLPGLLLLSTSAVRRLIYCIVRPRRPLLKSRAEKQLSCLPSKIVGERGLSLQDRTTIPPPTSHLAAYPRR